LALVSSSVNPILAQRVPLELIEVQSVPYLSEDDVVRFEHV